MNNTGTVIFLFALLHCGALVASNILSEYLESHAVDLRHRMTRSSSFEANDSDDGSCIVRTKLGKIRGKKVQLENGKLKPVIQYLGIPYAEPPVNELRWSKTKKKEVPWKGIYNATDFGPVCPQPRGGPLPEVLLPVWYRVSNDFIRRRSRKMAEDCLYLNIYVPASQCISNRESPLRREYLPVMVYFHGHTFSEGSGNFYDGSVLASFGNVIVVTFNYRLGVLGFLSILNKNLLGNYGLWDQIMLLQWVQDNIKQFGGNPNRVTAFGSGAGAASIGLLMLSSHTEPDTKGLFLRAILQSGSALSPWAVVKEPRTNAKSLAGHPKIGCNRSNTKKMVDCLRNISWSDLINIKVNPKPYQLAFGPVIDGGNELLNAYPLELLKRGEFTNYDVIIGFSQADGFGYIRDRLRACSSCNRNDSSISYFAMKALYTRTDFGTDLKSFVDSFYSSSETSITLIERLVKFMYTNWSNPEDPSLLKRSLMQLYTDRQWVRPAIQKADFQATYTHPAFFYVFSHFPGTDSERSWVRCSLGEDIPFVFGAPLLEGGYPLFPYNFTKTDSMVSVGVMTYWTNFAKNGNPNNGIRQQTTYLGRMPNKFRYLDWSRYNVSLRKYLDISSTPGVFNNYRADKVALWSDFLPGFSGLPYQKIKRPAPSYIKPARYLSTESDTSSTNVSGRHGGGKQNEIADSNIMDMQLSMTLAVGFVLLFVNIIAFAIVSYHKEKEKYQIVKLQSQLKEYRRKYPRDRSGSAQNGCSRIEASNLEHRDLSSELESTRRKSKEEEFGAEMTSRFSSSDKRSQTTDLVLNLTPISPPLENSAPKSCLDAVSLQTPEHPEKSQSSAISLLTPNHSSHPEMFRFNQTRNRVNDFVSWPKSEIGEMSAGKINFENQDSLYSLQNHLPKNTTAPAAVSSIDSKSDYISERKRPRCVSALGLPQGREHGIFDSFSSNSIPASHLYSSRPLKGKDHTRIGSEQTIAISKSSTSCKPSFHYSVQCLPFSRAKDFPSRYSGTFNNPPPFHKQMDVFPSKRASQKSSGSRNAFMKGNAAEIQAAAAPKLNSVTTKL